MPRYAARTDEQHAEIRDTLRELGWLVRDTSRLGGFCDLVAWNKRGRLALIEVKTARSSTGRVSRTRAQRDMLQDGWPVVTLTTRDEAIAWATGRET